MHFPSFALLLASAACVFARPNSSPNPDPTLLQRDSDLNFLGCGPSDAIPCSLKNAQACVNYLIAAGDTLCNATQDHFTYFCKIDDCKLTGTAVGASSASSYCKDVGYGAQAIIDKCKNNGKVRGHNTAGGNGNLALEFRDDQ